MFSFDAKRAFFCAIKKFLANPLLTSIISPIEPNFAKFTCVFCVGSFCFMGVFVGVSFFGKSSFDMSLSFFSAG